ncbi:ribonuclease H-like domain-containing protein [Tanacetum coccineum]
MSMNYQPIFVGNQTNGHASTKENIDAGQARKKIVLGPQYVLLPFFTSNSQSPKSSEDEVVDDARKMNDVLDLAKEGDMNGQREATDTNSTNRLNTVSSSVNTVSSTFTIVEPRRKRIQRNKFESVFGQEKDANGNNTYRIFTPVSVVGSYYDNLELNDTADLQDTDIFSGAYDDEDVGVEADLNNIETTMNNAWRLVDLPKAKHAIGTKWVYRNKKDERGIVVRNKARLVAQGDTQEEGIEYDEVFFSCF